MRPDGTREPAPADPATAPPAVPSPTSEPVALAAATAETVVIACVDLRFVDPLVDWLRAQGLRGRYDLRTQEGASLAVDRWQDSAATIAKLHDARAIWIVDHAECGAYGLAGEANTRENHLLHLKVAQARVQARVGVPTRIFYHPLGPDGLGAPTLEEIGL